MRRGRRIFTGIALIGTLGLLGGCASSSNSATGANTLEGGVKIPSSAAGAPTSTTVNVTLGDTAGLVGPMTLTVSPSTVPAGDVTFVVKNKGTIVHEAVVLKTNTEFDKLPITYGGDPPVPVAKGANKVSEDANVGETGDPDLEPGGTRTFTIKNMAAGSYAVVCNIAQHYGKGMRAAFTVTDPARTVNVALGDSGAGGGSMTLTLSPSTVPTGDVTFVVKNNGTIVHEAVVLKTNLPFDKLPITDGGDPPVPVKTGANKVSEDANVGETGDPDLEPGGTRTFTIKNMAAGSYAVVCNIAGHYGKGMRAALKVTNPTTTVNVALGDSGAGGPMTLSVSPATAPAGDVTFVVKNNGTIVHEAVVLKTNTEFDKLPITDGGDPPVPVKTGANKVSEDANVGETGDPDLEPGGTRTFTIKNMAAGSYVIVCNIAQHYGKGMRAAFAVTDPARTVNVTLGDSGAAGPMTLTVSPATVPAGDVTFVVKNDGTIEHEAVVLKTDVPFDKLPITYGGDPPAPVTSGANKVSEDANIGETGDPNLKPGDTRVFTIKHMAAGSYVVVCNIALHYGKGMRASLKVG